MLDLTGRYCSRAVSDAHPLLHWNFDPLLLVALAALLVPCLRAGDRRTAALAAWGTTVLAFVSPVCALSASLFAGRAVHHILLVGAVAPLAAIAWPSRLRVGPVVGLALHAATLWAWHVPALYDAALADVGLYWLMQATLVGGAWVFWSAVFASPPAWAATAVTGGAFQMGLLGALLSFAPRPLYESHLATTVAYGLGPLADQQLAGLVMWVPGMVPYAVVGALLLRGGWRGLSALPRGAA